MRRGALMRVTYKDRSKLIDMKSSRVPVSRMVDRQQLIAVEMSLRHIRDFLNSFFKRTKLFFLQE